MTIPPDLCWSPQPIDSWSYDIMMVSVANLQLCWLVFIAFRQPEVKTVEVYDLEK